MECFTSPRLEKKSNTFTPFDMNVRAVQAFLAICGDHASGEKFCMFLTMPLMLSKTFNEIKCYIKLVYSLASQTVLNYVHNRVQNAYSKLDQLKLVCKTCSEQKMECFTSPRLEKKSNTFTPFDMNVRAVQAFLAICGDHASGEKFCMFLTMPLMSSKTFNEIKCYIKLVYSLASQTVLNYVHNSVQNAYSKLDQNRSNTVTDIAVSFDGTWLTRGHTPKSVLGV
ncbi:uncharacterized protein TNCV_1845051 [Trichonephila clavipes]|nr:uncharacterized protein TNCV_1845051 [Trichonephila clavipes]